MQILPDASATEAPPEPTRPSLLHEWFVTYNPTYLASAALVLGGLTLVARAAGERGAFAGFGVEAIAELYALALIGSAAVLRRCGERRAAVMVGLLAVLYQGDLTMHLETSAFVGAVGWAGVLGWIALFAIKLRLLARALGLTLSRSAFLVPTLGAGALALLPIQFVDMTVQARATLTALVVFGVLAAFAWTSRDVRSEVGFDVRGRRAIRGVWATWGVLAALHVLWWGASMRVSLVPLAPAIALVLTRWATRERTVWIVAFVSLALTAWASPALLPAVAAMSTIALTLRALRRARIDAPPIAERAAPPYRGATTEAVTAPTSDITDHVRPPITFVLAPARERERLLLGAAASLHLALSTIGVAEAGALAHASHAPLVDLGLALVCVAFFVRGRRAVSFAPLVPMGTHLAVADGWLTAPRNALELGAWAIASGFAVLGASVAYSVRTRASASPSASADDPDLADAPAATGTS